MMWGEGGRGGARERGWGGREEERGGGGGERRRGGEGGGVDGVEGELEGGEAGIRGRDIGWMLGG